MHVERLVGVCYGYPANEGICSVMVPLHQARLGDTIPRRGPDSRAVPGRGTKDLSGSRPDRGDEGDTQVWTATLGRVIRCIFSRSRAFGGYNACEVYIWGFWVCTIGLKDSHPVW